MNVDCYGASSATPQIVWSQAREIPKIPLPAAPSHHEIGQQIRAALVAEHLEPLCAASSRHDFMMSVPEHFPGIMLKLASLSAVNAQAGVRQMTVAETEELMASLGAQLDTLAPSDRPWKEAVVQSLRSMQRVQRIMARFHQAGFAEKHPEPAVRAGAAMIYWIVSLAAFAAMAAADVAATNAAREAVWFCLTDAPREAYSVLRAVEMAGEESEEDGSQVAMDAVSSGSDVAAEMMELDWDLERLAGGDTDGGTTQEA